MARWKPDARGRLQRAALELFAERGFEQTTALEVAERAGVTERTFFRYFPDKREVLFDGAGELQRVIVESIDSAPATLAPIDVVGAAMQVGAGFLEGGREYSRQRAAVIAANPSLQERELLKLASLGAAVAEALRRRGAPELTAALAAEAGVSVFKIGFETWIGDDSAPEFRQCIRSALDQLTSLTAASTRTEQAPDSTTSGTPPQSAAPLSASPLSASPLSA
ncbi:MAG: transcriptional regulator, TetR family [Subtercola sp.]|nr:transcriptional regulator, TetR family [Subtercola sp.]